MPNKVVIGTGFGDEGKGLVTDYLSHQSYNPLVIRFSGGQQAGHTVRVGDIRHVFSNFGSGTIRGASTYWSKYCTVDPIGIINELEDLLKKGVEPLLLIDAKCPITTPYDAAYNQKTDINNGTVGVGVGTTWEREKNHYSLLFEDLFNDTILKIKLRLIGSYYNSYIDKARFLECVKLIRTEYSYYIEMVTGIPENQFETNIFEGSQGLLLSQDIGFFPHVTRSSTGTKNVIDLIGHNNIDIYLVTRAYQTRHGNGPITNSALDNSFIKDDPNETNVYHRFQGEFRKSILDLDLIKYGILKDGGIKEASLVITCLDHLDKFMFTHNGKVQVFINDDDFVKNIANILGETFKIKQVLLSKSPYSDQITKYQ